MIGKEVAKRAQGFNMTVLAYDVFPDRAFAPIITSNLRSLITS
jgi:phosphoglycerate dehydrogenase-like enzyme